MTSESEEAGKLLGHEGIRNQQNETLYYGKAEAVKKACR